MNYTAAMTAWEKAEKLNPADAYTKRCMAQACFDHLSQPARALELMKQALELAPDNARILYELLQMEKNLGFSVKDRLHLLETHSELAKMRDDCFLDEIILYAQDEQYEKARELLLSKRFNIYEGGEGNLTKQHAWMHVLYANELASAGKAAEAYQVYMNGVNMPKSYGEAKTWFNQEAHIFYYLGTLLESLGKTKEAANAFEEASVYKAAVSELSMFRALALRKLMRFSQAQQVLMEMLESGDNLLKNKDLRSYYGVGSPTPMPFEYDIVKINSVNGHILRGYALLGLGRRDEAEAEIAQAATYSPNDFRIYAFHQVKDTF